MQSFSALEVIAPSSIALDHGEGWIDFIWSDSRFGREGLTIQLDGHCSRMMPIRSGYGLRDFDLRRDCVILRFEPTLAAKLELNEEVEIGFSITDDEFSRLKAALGSSAVARSGVMIVRRPA